MNAQQILALAQIGYWELDFEGGALVWSNETHQIHGTDPSIFKPEMDAALDFFTPMSRSKLFAAMEEARVSRAPIDLELDMTRADGHLVHISLKADVIVNGNKIRHIQGVIQDITESKIQQAELARRARLSSLGEMAAGIAHEINNPLMIVLGMERVIQHELARPAPDMDQVKHALGRIEDTCNRIAKIIRGLRAFAREAIEENPQEVLVSDVIEDTLSLCSDRFRTGNIKLEAICDSSLRVTCREVQIVEVLLNLLNNAYDAVAQLDKAWVRLEALDKGEEIEISITDSGHGLPPQLALKLTNFFFTTKSPGHGTGLGLKISKRIAEDHRGRLWYDESSKHTRFVLSLPKNNSAS